MSILVTGGAGYIGSHTCVELLNQGYEVVVLDNLCNSSRESLRRVTEITGKQVVFYEADMADRTALERIFQEQSIDTVIHFAGLKAVGESVAKPLEYYKNNVTGTLVLCEAMRAHGVKRLVFSSSATVYGNPHTVPITEEFPLSVTNPYGRSKLILEDMLRDIAAADQEWKIILLRYFNPIGAHESGKIGEDPRGIPNNLVPYVAQVAIGKLEQVGVFGNDYATIDGTGVRDYIHVVDLAKGHCKAILRLNTMEQAISVYNLGTGQGYSVLEVIHSYEKAAQRRIPFVIKPRRPGDIAACYADTSLAEKELGWQRNVSFHELVKLMVDSDMKEIAGVSVDKYRRGLDEVAMA